MEAAQNLVILFASMGLLGLVLGLWASKKLDEVDKIKKHSYGNRPKHNIVAQAPEIESSTGYGSKKDFGIMYCASGKWTAARRNKKRLSKK